MIQANTQSNRGERAVKAVGLISGGLDSTVAAQVVKDLGVEVHGVYFAMPWGCCNKSKAMEAAAQIGIKLIVLQLDERYLEIIRSPKHGRGSALNPCVDCRIHMFSRAAQYMRHIGADFVFTGEVLGQRPMSQMRHSMKRIEEETGLQGRLLRPLCARVLEPTILEQEGLIDRNKLLSIMGRGRKEQIQLAEGKGLTGYNQPAGGCLLTDRNFSRRMEDTLEYGYRNFRETVALQWGRHFRINKDFKVIVGRDEEENTALMHFAHPDDYILQLDGDVPGPTAILKGYDATDDCLATAAGLIQHFSRLRNDAPQEVRYWKNSDKNTVGHIRARRVNIIEMEKMYI